MMMRVDLIHGVTLVEVLDTVGLFLRLLPTRVLVLVTVGRRLFCL